MKPHASKLEIPARQPVQPPRSWASGAMNTCLQSRRGDGHPVQSGRSRVIYGMNQAGRWPPTSDNEGMESRDGFAHPEGQLS